MGAASHGIDIVDAQLHLYEADCARFPWDPGVLADPRLEGMRGRFAAHSASPAEVLALLDAHGVSGTLVVTSGIYGLDNSYSRHAWEVAPERFRVVGLLDPEREDIEEAVASCAADPAFAGLRLNLESEAAVARYRAGAFDRELAAAEREGVPMCILSPGRLPVFEDIARRFEGLSLVLDHLGLFSVAMLDPEYGDTFAGVEGVVALAAFENITVKVSSLPMLSREPYPYNDVWPHLHVIIEAFGAERLMWGSDAIVFEHPYEEMLGFLLESEEIGRREKEQMLGETLRRVWGWPRVGAAA